MSKMPLFAVQAFAAALAITFVLVPVHQARAQADAGMDEIESLYSKEETAPAVEAPAATPAPTPTPEATKLPPIKDVSDLGKLQPFNDIAVIQKRFLPKSDRWEIFIGPSLNLNDAFFFDFGGNLRLGYYFRERYGVEGNLAFLSSSTRSVTDELYSRNVKTSSFITPQGFYGLDFKWLPIYGKMTLANKKITPFDLYFSFGAGLTPTNQSSNEMTLHLGSGQIFALTKSTAFRWDFSWYMFTAASSVDPSGNRSLYHNILLTLGWSWFFPEANYR